MDPVIAFDFSLLAVPLAALPYAILSAMTFAAHHDQWFEDREHALTASLLGLPLGMVGLMVGIAAMSFVRAHLPGEIGAMLGWTLLATMPLTLQTVYICHQFVLGARRMEADDCFDPHGDPSHLASPTTSGGTCASLAKGHPRERVDVPGSGRRQATATASAKAQRRRNTRAKRGSFSRVQAGSGSKSPVTRRDTARPAREGP